MSAAPARPHYTRTLGVLAIGAMAFALLQTMVAPALPAIQSDLDTSTTAVTWTLTAYLLSASIATPILGRLGDIFGKERMLVAVLVLFALGCLVSAVSHSLGGLVAGRVIQGAAGAVFPLAIGIIRDEFPPARVATGIGAISATFGIGGGAGLVLAGVLVDNASYEWIFWFGFAVAIVAVVCTHLFVPESPVKSPARIDWAGALVLSAGLGALLLGVSQGSHWGWDAPGTLGLIGAGVAVLALWVRLELRVAQPLVDMRLLRHRGVWTTNLTTLLVGFGMFGSFILVPQLVRTPADAGYGFGVDTTGAGLFMMPSTLVMLVAGPLSGALAGRIGSKPPALAGIAFTAISFLWLAVAHDTRLDIYGSNALLGLGIGMSFAAIANLIVEAVPATQTGETMGMNAIMRTIGGALGAQVAAVIVAGHATADGRFPAESGYQQAFALGAGALVVALLVALAIPRRRAGRQPAVTLQGSG